MSSVVNKSKNKFVPKAKVRPRPGATATQTNTLNPTPPSPINQPQIIRVPHVTVASSIVSESAEPTPLSLQRDDPPPAGIEPQRLQVPVPVIRATNADGVPTLRQTNIEPSPSSSPHSGIPVVRSPSSSRGIPRVRSAADEIPTIQVSSTVTSPESAKATAARANTWLATVLRRSSDEPYSQGATQEVVLEASEGGSGTQEREPSSENASGGDSSTVEKAAKPVRKRKGKITNDEPLKKYNVAQGKRKAVESGNNDEQEERRGQADGQEAVIDKMVGEEAVEFQPVESEAAEDFEIEAHDSDYSLYEDPKAADKPRKARQPRKPRARKPPREKSSSRRRPERHHREGSPEDGEEREITPSVMKMKDLCKDIKIGRKSKRFIELAQMDWTKLANEQKAAKEAPEARKAAGEEVVQETAEERIERLANERQNFSSAGVPQMRMVNGELVLDQESIQVNSHEREPIDEGSMEVVEENMAFRRITSASYSRHKKVERWDTEETHKFYNALSMFGTDFEIVSKLFPGRNRQQLRKKYLTEERKYPQKITNALRTRVPINVTEYSEMAEIEIGDPQLVEEELVRIREAHHAEEEAAIGHAVEMERERQENANAAMRAGDEAAVAAADQSKRGRKKKGAKNRGEAGHGEEEILSMTREEYEAERLRELAKAEGL